MQIWSALTQPLSKICQWLPIDLRIKSKFLPRAYVDLQAVVSADHSILILCQPLPHWWRLETLTIFHFLEWAQLFPASGVVSELAVLHVWNALPLTFCIAGSFSLRFHFFFFPFIFISWRLITLQYCSGFCHTLTWVSHGFTCIPHPDPPSHLPLYPIPLGLPSAPGPSTCLMHPTWAGDLFHPR